VNKGKRTYRIMISGGGTGGHIYPAIAIANAWREKYPDAEILFVGAEGKMEMQKVPEAGYIIEGLPVAGLQRSLSLSNLSFPFKLFKSLRKSKKLVKEFNPEAVVGVGGYASGPLLRVAQAKGIPTLLQEQNSYAGLTNKLLAKKAKVICVAYPEMEKFFPQERIKYTGNPVRKDILQLKGKQEVGLKYFGLETGKKVLLVLGGSLGARTINHGILADMEALENGGYQILWQCGKFYFREMSAKVKESGLKHIHVLEFIKEMDLAYAVADVVVSRAGALSVSELSLVGKPVVFIPSPNVAEDHQTKNALAYVNENAALLLKDDEAVGKIKETLDGLFAEEGKAEKLSKNILKLAKPDAAEKIVEALEEIIA
jgi:UDP-N-acetylglucosamine--N-acetylmuramyl-(pentapeptide) pyrophosphoryl-undecaprenol N-acetylglucosamine transferase